MFDYLIIFSSCLEKVIATIILTVMASYDDSTFGRVDFMVKEEHTSEDHVDKLVKVHTRPAHSTKEFSGSVQEESTY